MISDVYVNYGIKTCKIFHKKLCNCGVNYTEIHYIIYIVLSNNSDRYAPHGGLNGLNGSIEKEGCGWLQIPYHTSNLNQL